MAHPSEEKFRTGYDAFAKGDLATLGELLADDVRWHTPGNNQLSGTSNGKEETFGQFAKIAELTGGTFSLDIHDLFANDQHGVALVVVSAEREGKKLESHAVHVVHFTSDGKVQESWFHAEDQQAVDDFWA